jgi:nucleoside-diphosphate-sugar epimerase
MSEVPIRVEVERSRARSREARSYVADVTRFQALTGWTPRIPLEQTLADTLDYWRLQERNQN